VLLLGSAAYELWLPLGLGNANFLYAMNLAWAAWQIGTLKKLLHAARQPDGEAAAAGAADESVGAKSE
jgi:hypothetical protein